MSCFLEHLLLGRFLCIFCSLSGLLFILPQTVVCVLQSFFFLWQQKVRTELPNSASFQPISNRGARAWFMVCSEVIRSMWPAWCDAKVTSLKVTNGMAHFVVSQKVSFFLLLYMNQLRLEDNYFPCGGIFPKPGVPFSRAPLGLNQRKPTQHQKQRLGAGGGLPEGFNRSRQL